MVNKYSKKDVKLLSQMIEMNPTQAYEIVTADCTPHTFNSMIMAYGYRLPLSTNNPFFWPGANQLMYRTPFVDVPKFINDPTVRLIATWRLRIGK